MLTSHLYSDKWHDQLLDDPRYQLLIIGRDFMPAERQRFKMVCQQAVRLDKVSNIQIMIEDLTQAGVSAMMMLPVVTSICAHAFGQVSDHFKMSLLHGFQVMKEVLPAMPLGWCVFYESSRFEASEVLRTYRHRLDGSVVVSLSSGSPPQEYRMTPYSPKF